MTARYSRAYTPPILGQQPLDLGPVYDIDPKELRCSGRTKGRTRCRNRTTAPEIVGRGDPWFCWKHR